MTSDLRQEALNFIRNNKPLLFEKFANLEAIPPSDIPYTMLMAGCAGAGKTETSKFLLQKLAEMENPIFMSRIDADEIKYIIPGYNGKNADDYQGASVLGLQKLIEYTLKNKQPALIDGTLSDYDHAKENIQRCLRHGRQVGILYIYQDPIDAYKLTLARRNKEGRSITKEFFVDSFFKSKKNAERLKREFGNKLTLTVLIKNYKNGLDKIKINVDNIDSYVKIEYDRTSLFKELDALCGEYK